MAFLADAFGPLVFVAGIGLLILAIRLNRRMSAGATGAGPLELIPPDPPGLQRTPWELTAIDEQLKHPATVGPDLITTLNRLVEAADLPMGRHDLWPEASRDDVERLVTKLERQLELKPLEDQ